MSRTCENHPAKAAAARGLCWACYAAARRDDRLPPKVERPRKADTAVADPDAPCCDVCADGDVKLIRFSLTVKALTPDGRPTSRGAGVIELCARCWTRCKRKSRMTKRLAKPTYLRSRAVA